ncbi:MAG: hypothetical protein NTX86_01720 [Candidatus Dependentiae bacterium]|nr:hypothetical protein [Candidatus Dependentiae bacterium]
MNIMKKALICLAITSLTTAPVYTDTAMHNKGYCPDCIIKELDDAVTKAAASLKKAQEVLVIVPEAQSLVRKITQLYTDVTKLRDAALAKPLTLKELNSLKYQAQALAQQTEDILNKYIVTLFGS